MRENFQCPHCKKTMVITTKEELADTHNRMTEANLARQRIERRIVEAFSAIEGVTVKPFDENEQVWHSGLCMDGNHHHLVESESVYDFIDGTFEVKALAMVALCRSRILEVGKKAFRQMPHLAGFGGYYFPLMIDGIPVRFIASYRFEKAAWMCTLDFYAEPFSNSWRDRPSQV